MNEAAISYEKKYVEIFGRRMAYVEVGEGDPIVFLHGNPASSYIWRNILPYLQDLGRCIAPDLIGMGDSDKLPESGPGSYTFVEHRRYLDELLEKLGINERVTFVGHDWGAALAFDWSYRHPAAVKGLAYMEAIAAPSSLSGLPERGRQLFAALRSPAGEEMVLVQNSFIEVNLPAGIIRKLTEAEMNEYRRPFAEPGEGRRPTLTWPRQLPIDGDPADVTEIVTTFGHWLAGSDLPKLYIRAEPGRVQPGQDEFCRTWPNQQIVTVPGLHNIQEDSPDQIGQAIAAWLKGL